MSTMQAPTGRPSPEDRPHLRPRAIVYCEGNFADIDGKTANGLVRHSEKYEILSVIDATKAGRDSGLVLDGVPNGIPLVAGLADALAREQDPPSHFIVGVAPTSGLLSPTQRDVIFDAISSGMHIVNGLHEFLNDDPEFASAAAAGEVEIIDVRRPRANVISGCSPAESTRSPARASPSSVPTVPSGSERRPRS